MDKTELLTQLEDRFGYSSFRPGQLEVIEAVLNGSDTVATLPTGSGKSLIYHFCGYFINGLVVIVSPLLSLMQDQVMHFKYQGEKRVAALNSLLTMEERNEILSALERYKFLFVSPEMLQNDRIQSRLCQAGVGLLAIDEAHCISQWGMDFRPDYLELGTIREVLQSPLTLALTATATPHVVRDMLAVLALDPENTYIYQGDINRKNIFYQVIECASTEKQTVLASLLKKYSPPGIIYFSSKAEAEEVNAYLQRHLHLRCDTYHADRTDEDRTTIQHQFQKGELEILCATSAFGMGINLPNIRFVIHYHMPASLEEYVQEIGRAGRDGNQALAVLLYSFEDFRRRHRWTTHTDLTAGSISKFLTGKLPEEMLQTGDAVLLQVIRQKKLPDDEAVQLVEDNLKIKNDRLQAMRAYAEASGCKRSMVAAYFERQQPLPSECCCSSCQPQISLPALENREQNPVNLYNENEGWEKTLKRLFLF